VPPVKHAAKHAAKHAKKHTPEQEGKKDLRRAYEHLGRVEAILSLAGDASPSSVHTLVQLAKRYLEGGLSKEGADLLRAAEHFSFASLPSNAKADTHADPKLMETVQEEFDKLSSRAEEHWAEHEDRSSELTGLFKEACEESKAAFEKRMYRQALEWARGAEALAHVPGEGRPKRLPAA